MTPAPTVTVADVRAYAQHILNALYGTMAHHQAWRSMVAEQKPDHRNLKRMQGHAMVDLDRRDLALLPRMGWVVHLAWGNWSEESAPTRLLALSLATQADTYEDALKLLDRFRGEDPDLVANVKLPLLRDLLRRGYSPGRDEEEYAGGEAMRRALMADSTEALATRGASLRGRR